MAVEVFGFPFGVLDLAGILLFLAATLGYHTAYSLYARNHPLETVKGKVHLFRRTWIKRILDRKDFILAVQAVRNLMMSANFLATASLLALSLIFTNLILAEGPGAPARAFHIENVELLPLKLYLLAAIFAFAFWEFLLAIRYLNQLTVLIGADPDLIAQVEGVDAVTYLTSLLNRATNRYTYGQRGFYFSTAVFAWIFSPVLFLLATVGMVTFFAVFLDFHRWRFPKALVKESELTQP